MSLMGTDVRFYISWCFSVISPTLLPPRLPGGHGGHVCSSLKRIVSSPVYLPLCSCIFRHILLLSYAFHRRVCRQLRSNPLPSVILVLGEERYDLLNIGYHWYSYLSTDGTVKSHSKIFVNLSVTEVHCAWSVIKNAFIRLFQPLRHLGNNWGLTVADF